MAVVIVGIRRAVALAGGKPSAGREERLDGRGVCGNDADELRTVSVDFYHSVHAAYRLPNGPDGANVDSVDALERQNTSKQGRNDDENTRAKQDADSNFASCRQLNLPQ